MALLSRASRDVLRILLLALALSVVAAAAELASREYQVKAAFLLNFTQYVDWPEDAFSSPDQPLRLGVLGDDPFGATLDRTVAGEQAHGRRIEVVRGREVADVARCHLVFLARAAPEVIDRALAGLKGPVLTVGDDETVVHRGGAMAFFLERGRVRFAIDPAVVKTARLQLAAPLLNLGRIVADQPDGAP